MNIGDLSERDFLNEVMGIVASTARREAFDDCVIIDLTSLTGIEELPYLVYSIDHPSFVRHATDRVSPYRFYGRWVAAVTCNDVVAMGARCKGFSLDLAAPLDTPIENVHELLGGVKEVLDDYGATYEGGNFDANALETVGFCWGTVPKCALVRRQGARASDLVAVTGILGQGWVEYLIRKNGLYGSLDPDIEFTLQNYKEMPVAAHRAITLAAEQGCFTSGMDLSDGLVDFLYTIASRNGVGVVIEAEKLPVSDVTIACLPRIAKLTDAPVTLVRHPSFAALEAGYDSPLVHGFTVSQERWTDAERLFQEAGSTLYCIGRVEEHPGVHLRVDGSDITLPPFWDDQCRSGGLTQAWIEFLQTLDAQI